MEQKAREDLISASRGEESYLPIVEALMPLVSGFYQFADDKFKKRETKNKHKGNVYLYFCSLFRQLEETEDDKEEGFDIIPYIKEEGFLSAPWQAYLTEKQEDEYEYSMELFFKYLENQ